MSDCERNGLTDKASGCCCRDGSSNRKSSIIIALLATIAVLFAGLLALGGAAFVHLQRTTSGFRELSDYIASPTGRAPPAAAVAAIANVAVAAAGEAFFLGSTDGSVASFINRLAGSDFGSLGAYVASAAQSTVNAFQASTTDCAPPVTCPNNWNEYVQCTNGETVFCPNPGAVVPCGSCWQWGVVNVASIVQSVAGRVAKVQQVRSTGTSPAAFSDGVFRLDALVRWARNQTSPAQWARAGQVCTSLAQSVGAVTWAGTYVDGNGQQQTWDENESVQNVAGTVQNVCSIVASMH
jgi:hypothetical protein